MRESQPIGNVRLSTCFVDRDRAQALSVLPGRGPYKLDPAGQQRQHAAEELGVKPPVRFVMGNLVSAQDARDCWALYRLELESYDGRTVAQKRELLAALSAFVYELRADFSLLRVSREWSLEQYAERARQGLHPSFGHTEALDDYLDAHRAALMGRAVVRPELYLSVRLEGPQAGTFEALAGRLGQVLSRPTDALDRAAGRRDPRRLGARRLRELSDRESAVFARVGEFFGAERASTLDVQWLVRRCFCRGLGEPDLDVFFRPQALVLPDPDEGLVYEPLEVDLLRLFESQIAVGDRALEVRGERGTSHQALLAVGALPESVSFPGPGAELLFAPLELPFAVDASLSARYVASERALALVRRKVVDADNAFREESRGDHGPAPDTAKRPGAGRALEDYLADASRPPLLHASIALAVGAGTGEELERRVGELRRRFEPVALHRPLGEQLNLFCQLFPAQPTRVADYADYLIAEQVGAMVPTATSAVGSEAGPYIGHTLSGSRQPVCFDPGSAAREDRPAAVLLSGAPGSGKSVCKQELLYAAFLRGERVVDADPKGDSRWAERLPEVAEHVEVIELSGDPAFRGLLDPLRIAPPDVADEVCLEWLCGLLKSSAPHEWETEIAQAIKDAITGAGGDPAHATCGDVLDRLAAGNDDAQEAGRALAVRADRGLTQLGFAQPGSSPAGFGERQVTVLRIANFALPAAGTAPEQMSVRERTSWALLRLFNTYALHLMGADWTRPKTLGFDEAWALPVALLERMARLGRAQNATVVLATQLLSDLERLENLVGAHFAFGVESEQEAAQALRLLRLDPDDPRARSRLLGFRRGRCLLRDHQGRVAPMQVHIPDPRLLGAYSTTPENPADPATQPASR